MRTKLNVLYRDAAEEFARRVVAALGDQVAALVLFGSAARGEAKRESDIDILVISPDPRSIKERVSQLRSDFAGERHFAFIVSLVHLSEAELRHLVGLRSPFIREVIAEGIILYDNGTFARVRSQAIAAR